MSDADIREQISIKVQLAMLEHRQNSKMRLYLILAAAMLLFITLAILFSINIFSFPMNEDSKSLLQNITAILISLYGAVFGYYFGLKSDNPLKISKTMSDLDVYKDVLSAREENIVIKRYFVEKIENYEEQVANLKKEITYLKSLRSSN